MHRSKRLVIFEGPDGGGKSTLAKEYARHTDSIYVHFPAMPRVTKGLARMYVEAMLPALLGYQDVVFDRSWLSEEPYGTVFREGQDRLGYATIRMLERLALRCDAQVVYCMPPVEVVKQNYRARKHLEMLENEDQLEAVYQLYKRRIGSSAMTAWTYDYTTHTTTGIISTLNDGVLPCHPLEVQSAGNWDAPIVLVGQDFAERKDQDPFYQWPFASFSRDGCSQWLTQELIKGGISERDLLWVNADQDISELPITETRKIITLGEKARQKLEEIVGCDGALQHPQYAKRFNQPYNLVSTILKLKRDLDKGE